jgi:hypothetical protein
MSSPLYSLYSILYRTFSRAADRWPSASRGWRAFFRSVSITHIPDALIAIQSGADASQAELRRDQPETQIGKVN